MKVFDELKIFGNFTKKAKINLSFRVNLQTMEK